MRSVFAGAGAALLCTLAGCITPPAYVPPEGVERYKESHLACMSLMYGVRDIHGPPSWNVYGWCMRQKGYPPKADESAPS
jgi:hypothetical protein